MPYSRPPLSALRQQVSQDIAAGLPGLDTLLRYANLRVLGDANAGLANGLYGYLDYIARQSVPYTSRGEALAGWGALRDVYIKEASKASGVTAVSFNATGGSIAAGTKLARGDGATFVVTADASPVAGIIAASVEAEVAGSAGNTAIGTSMFLTSGIANVSPNGNVTVALTGGADVETQDEFLVRVLQAYQRQPAGGSKSDYEKWALDIPGVTRAWCIRRAMGGGTVGLLFMMDDIRADYGGFPQGTNGVATSEDRDIVATGDQLLIANALYDLQPADALVYGFCPTPNTIGLTIAGIAGASTATKAAIATAFASALKSDAVPGGTTPLSSIEAAIAAVSGASGFVITAVTATAGTVTAGATGNIVSNTLALPVAGGITYI